MSTFYRLFTAKQRRRRLIWVVCTINVLFWTWLWLDVRRNVQPFIDRAPQFEEIVPVYKFGELAIPSAVDHQMTSLKAMRIIHQPTYFAVVMVANWISGGSWDARWGYLSIGTYVLIATMIGSFIQWTMLVWLIGSFFRSSKTSRISPAS